MPEFDNLRRQLRQTSGAIDAAARQVAAARVRLQQISARLARLDRVFSPNNDGHVTERERLRAERAEAEAELALHREERADAAAIEAGLLNSFASFTDPRESIAQLNDSTPILLMPIRLETRFKEIKVPGNATLLRQLWVRVYPDDLWIDSFDPVLTEAEVVNAKTYWTDIWQAGGIEDQERGAWRGLVTSHGSGRASWIVEQYQPVNLAQKPTKPHPHDVILTIPADAALTSIEESAAKEFWRQVWLADGEAVKTQVATQALEAAVGAARAREIVARYQPINLAAPLDGGLAKADVNASVSFVVFPGVETKQIAWSSPPRLAILPDRFVFIGYRGEGPPLVVLGNPVVSPLAAGPDPSAPEEEQLQHDAHGNLLLPDEMKWIADFDRAVDVGMAFRIPLTELQATEGFDRVLVVGLRLRVDEQAAKAELETLLRHHAWSRTGLSVVPQGTPTNNTEAVGSGHGRQDDPDQSFDDRKAPLFTFETDWLSKKDGQWLAEYLGLDPAVFEHAHDAGATDQRVARAMNAALWPATVGYWMETMMAPVFSPEAITQTRAFFTRYVSGAGPVPAIRIGAQPYGILPATAWSRMGWLNQPLGNNLLPYLQRLYPLLRNIQRAPFGDVSYVGKPGDPHRTLLDIVGLHSGSVEWSQRYAEDIQTVIERLKLQGWKGTQEDFKLAIEFAAAKTLLGLLGYSGDETPKILEKVFSGSHYLLKGGVVDDKPLSESEGIRPYTAANSNYIQWLIDAANTSLDALYKQDGFIDDKPPSALLYLLLRHALQLGYHDVSVGLHEDAGLFTVQQAALARSEDPFLHLRTSDAVSESRYQPLYAVQPAITGSNTQTVGSYIASQLGTLLLAFPLREQIDALERLKNEPTARLERAFADHIDCCAYRLDAWLLGLVNVQLTLMRNIKDREDTPARQGIHLGAYAWLEDLRSEHKVLTPVVLHEPGLIDDFGGEPPLVRDNTNQGYIHAPSLNHAVAAAVLRNGYISNASPQNRQTMAVNLTSERVRTAVAMIEGIRAGQGLADLLGYQFERGLHDRHNLAEVDKFIYKLRKAFPLRADRLKSTKTAEGVAIEAIEARNVVDGLAMVEHIKATGNKTYPFGKSSLPPVPPVTATEAAAISAEAERLLESHDAVADLALAEGVYQAVLGNYDRVASTYDAYARGSFPPEPEVIRTPFNSIGLTHRVGLHLEAGADPAVSPVTGIAVTPRAQGEPALNRWLAAVLPPPEQVSCVVSFREAATGAVVMREVTLRQLALQPLDLLAIVHDDSRQAMTELDDRVHRFVVEHLSPRPDVPVTIRYIEKQAAPFSVFELWPLVQWLRRLTSASRPLKATDLTLMNEATSGQDSDVFVDEQRLTAVRDAMKDARDGLSLLWADFEGPLSDLDNRRGEILSKADDYVAALSMRLSQAALFSVPQAGWGFAYDFRRRTFAAMVRQCAERVARWDDRLVEFDDHIDEHNALPTTATDEERFRVLRRAERAISTVETTPLPATPAAFLSHLLTVKRQAFVDKRNELAEIQDTTLTDVSSLLTHIAAILPTTAFDVVEFTLTSHEDEMIRFARDALSVVTVVIAEMDRRLAASKSHLDAHKQAASAPDRVHALERAAKALLGNDFRIFPEFSMTAALGQELQNALTASRSGDLFKYLVTPPDPATPPLEDVPVDTWLYGVARVRPKMRAWEQMIMMAGSLGRPEPALDAMQLPFTPGDRWLALEFPRNLPLTSRFLYTAHFAAPFDDGSRQCGMLLDEWTETIPGPTADTGIVFHHDRPNSEAPQAMLLVTPSAFRGAWQWNDLVDALNETLEFAKRRALEPSHIDRTAYAPFLPATIMAVQSRQLTIAANLALNNISVLMTQQG